MGQGRLFTFSDLAEPDTTRAIGKLQTFQRIVSIKAYILNFLSVDRKLNGPYKRYISRTPICKMIKFTCRVT